jgi:hypothetical protein
VMAAPIASAQGTSVAVRGNRVYAFSGLFPSPAKVFVYDATTDVWTSRALPLLALVALGSVGSAGGEAHCADCVPLQAKRSRWDHSGPRPPRLAM